jgi:hypothetical protein
VVIARGTATTSFHVQNGVDDDERQALEAEGLDADDPAVIKAIDLRPMGTVSGAVNPVKRQAAQAKKYCWDQSHQGSDTQPC